MTEPARRLAPPGGHPPPTRQTLLDGSELDLLALATEICKRYREEFPDEQDRYGEAGVAWCKHDNQHILNWAVLAEKGLTDFDEQLAWLARVLEARDFPLDRLARNLEIAASVVMEVEPPDGAEQITPRLSDGAALIRSKRSFLDR